MIGNEEVYHTPTKINNRNSGGKTWAFSHDSAI
jgi:hypothetical protein